MKYKLLIVALDFFPNVGGISFMVHHLANAFCQMSCDVKILVPRGCGAPEGFDSNYAIIIDKDSSANIRSGRGAAEEDKRVERLLLDIRKDYAFDRILLAHPFYYGCGVVQFSRKYGIKCSSFFYAFELRSQILTMPSLPRRFYNRLTNSVSLAERTREVVTFSDELLPISTYTRDLLNRWPNKKNIYVTGCGLSMEDFNREVQLSPTYNKNERISRRKSLGLPENRLIGFVGRLVKSKNVDFFLNVLSLLPDVEGVVVGTGPEEGRLKAVAHELGIERRTHFLGAVNEHEKWAVLRALDCFCLFSMEMDSGQVEGFGIVLLEASAAGAPIFAAKSGGMVDVIQDSIDGALVTPGDANEAAEKINAVLENDKLASQYVAYAREKIRSRFNWLTIAEKISSRWEGIYNVV